MTYSCGRLTARLGETLIGKALVGKALVGKALIGKALLIGKTVEECSSYLATAHICASPAVNMTQAVTLMQKAAIQKTAIQKATMQKAVLST